MARLTKKQKEAYAKLDTTKALDINVASALILSPDKTKMILEEKFSHSKMKSYHAKLVDTKKETEKHNKSCLKGRYNVTYKFNENVLQGETDVEIKKDSIRLKGFSQPIKLK